MKNSIQKLKPIGKNLSEKDLERKLVKKVEEIKGIAYKFSSPNRRHVPDRLCVFPGGHVIFIEIKKPGAKPSPAQSREMIRIHTLGFLVTFINCEEDIDYVIDYIKGPKKVFISKMFEAI